MASKTNVTTSGALVLLLSMLFSSQGMSNDAALDCNQPETPVASRAPLTWPHVKQKTALTPECWVSAEQVDQWRQEYEPIWVDVRSQIKRQANPIEGALEIALASIQDKTFLHDRRVILIGDGFDQPELDQACQRLREHGFEQVYALKNGVQSHLAGSHLADAAANGLSNITPAELLAGSRSIPWTIITWDLSYEDSQKLPEKPAEQWFSAEGNLSLLSQRLAELSQTKRHQTMPSAIVIITADSQSNQQLRSLLQQHGTTANLLWLDGGMQAYQQYIQQQHDIWINAGRSLKRPCFGVGSRQ